MSRLTALALVVATALFASPADARRNRRNDLIRVTSPPVRGSAPAHPFVQFNGPDIIFPGIPVQFSARASVDPDLDQMTFHWDFGDTTTSEDRDPPHVFPDTSTDLTVRLAVSDGQQTATSEKTLFACP